MSVKENFGGSITGLALITASVLGLFIHVWTIVIAFSLSGIFAAVLTLIFPVLSEIYWFIRIGLTNGFDSNFCLAIIAYVGLFVVAFVGAMIASSGESSN